MLACASPAVHGFINGLGPDVRAQAEDPEQPTPVEEHDVSLSRRILFATMGLVLPVALAATTASAATQKHPTHHGKTVASHTKHKTPAKKTS
jgi:hypothetical protein